MPPLKEFIQLTILSMTNCCGFYLGRVYLCWLGSQDCLTLFEEESAYSESVRMTTDASVQVHDFLVLLIADGRLLVRMNEHRESLLPVTNDEIVPWSVAWHVPTSCSLALAS